MRLKPGCEKGPGRYLHMCGEHAGARGTLGVKEEGKRGKERVGSVHLGGF